MRLAKRFTKGVFVILLGATTVACSVNVAEKHWKMAEDFERRGQHLRAIEEYTRVVNFERRSPVATRAQLKIAEIYERDLKDYTRAINAYRDAYRRTDENRKKLEARFKIAKIYQDLVQDPSSSIIEYEALMQEGAGAEKEGPEILLAWSKALSEAGRFSDAAEKFALYRQTYPTHKGSPRALLEEGQAWLADRKPEKALERFQEVITRYSGQTEYVALVAEAQYGVGSCYEDLEKLEQALTAFRASLATYPNPKVVELKIQRVEKRKKERRF